MNPQATAAAMRQLASTLNRLSGEYAEIGMDDEAARCASDAEWYAARAELIDEPIVAQEAAE